MDYWPIIALAVTQLVTLAVVKTDTRWIKSSLKSGATKMERHAEQLARHQAQLAAIRTVCKSQHGTEFNDGSG